MTDDDSLAKFFEGVKPVPRARPGGGQVGVVPPAQRQYKGKYRVVSPEEADANMVARQKGRLAPIAGGLDDPEVTLEQPEPKIPPKQSPGVPQPRKVSPPPVPPEEDFGLADGDVLTDPAPPELATPPPRRYRPQPVEPPAEPTQMVMMEIRQEHQDGTFATLITVGLPVSHIEQNSNSVTLVSPLGASQYVFFPSPGSDIILSGAGLDNLHVFYPGTSFTLKDHGISCMSFVKAK